MFSTFSASQPQIYVDVDRIKAQAQGVDLQSVFDTLQAYLGSLSDAGMMCESSTITEATT